DRAAIIASGVALFLIIFRPFGLTIDNWVEAIVVLGFAPLNFIAILAVHAALGGSGRWRAFAGAASVMGANLAYLMFWSTGALILSSGLKVALIAALVTGAVATWNRYRTLKAEIYTLQSRQRNTEGSDLVVLKGDDANEILRVSPTALRYARARGNYVEIHYQQAGAPKTITLRATLASIDEQAGAALMRCHRSFLVNLNTAQRLISDRRGMRVEFSSDESAPVSRSYRNKIREAAQA
ncbi:MAG: LytTR family DNA-binding domain-containing protein, partial [Hyphococcus sp.]